MKIENQVCSMEQAKKLNLLRVKAESLYRWVTDEETTRLMRTDDNPISVYGCFRYPAYTVAELEVALSVGGFYVPYMFGQIDNKSEVYCCVQLETWCTPNVYRCVIRDRENNRNLYEAGIRSTGAQARAAMLIYLLENGHITAEEVNERLKEA